jgi:hypothetical protein
VGAWADQWVMLERPLPVAWEEQRSVIGPINSVMADG